MPEISIKNALNKAFIKVRPQRACIDNFKKNFMYLQECLKLNAKEHEEHLKNLVSDFLKNTWYGKEYYINTKDRIDLAIHTGKDSSDPVGVIIETKTPGNKTEMIKKNNLDSKAMQELLFYYLQETVDNNNIDLKHLVITNINEWYIFDAKVFYNLFSLDKNLVEHYKSLKNKKLNNNKSEYFYSEIASPAIRDKEKEIKYVYFNINDYEKTLTDTDGEEDNKLIGLYKIFSPEHLLKLSFKNDSNSLNQSFYDELLYIMGLSEETTDGKKVIIRKKPEDRKEGSLIENTLFQLSIFEFSEEKIYEIALELTITWINRILFLKLLESQQIKYQKDNSDYAFLNIDKIKDFNDLNTLFFNVLAKEPKERDVSIKSQFKYVPYLNSSLFDLTNTERTYIKIVSLKDKAIEIFKGTVLKDNSGNKRKGNINNLSYIFEFLDAYDFSSEGSEEIQEENKTLINASVLGLIFEKINGYKDGSYFTPGFITTYICRETIRHVVLNKFNELKNWNAGCFDELKNYIDNKSINGILEANNIINSITICDPAVGSGHFLVSALNEIITIKSELGILADNKGIKLQNCNIEIVNDELIILDDNSNFYNYNFRNLESRRIQETIFQEKRRIIEGSLFGVDINTNSVKICRLRLWIELLKNAYYTEESNHTELETLPNIDINIKCGNSLISRFNLDIDLKEELSKLTYTVKDYQDAVYKYKNAVAKKEKEELDNLITAIKDNFKGGVQKNTILSIKKIKLHGELNLLTQGELFGLSQDEQIKKEKRLNEIEQKIREIEQQIEDINNNVIYENAFEWRFEFPELLNQDGDFIGFDAIIGNPPYIQLQSNHGELANIYSDADYECFSRTGDIYQLFYEKGYEILKEKRCLCFITSNKWMRAAYGEKTRNFLSSKTNPKILIDFAGKKVFDSATVDVNIILIEKDENEKKTISCIVKDDFKNNMAEYIEKHGTTLEFLSSNSWVILNPLEKRIKEKIENIGVPLKEWDISINYGIKTGCNEAFIIDKQKRDELIKKDKKSAEIIRPILRGRDIARYQVNFADLYLINTHNGIPSKNIPPIEVKEYPVVKEHLDKYWTKIKNRDDQGVTPYNLRSCIYTDDFFKQKIVYREISNKMDACFISDEMFINNKSYMITGSMLEYLLGILNSSLFNNIILKSANVTGGKGADFLNQIRIPYPEKNDKITPLVYKHIEEKDSKKLDKDIDIEVARIYNLSNEEIEYINSCV